MMTDIDLRDGQSVEGKICTRCKAWKKLTDFHTSSKKKDGKASHCKSCDYERKAKFRSENTERVRSQSRDLYKANPEKRRAAHQKWKTANPEKMKEAKKRCASTPKGRVERNVRGYIHKTITKGYKSTSTFKALGYESFELMEHLESLFRPGMSWENYGKWHIDHIIPLSVFPYSSTADYNFKAAWALKNLQPLWADENIRKHAKIDRSFQPFLPLSEGSESL